MNAPYFVGSKRHDFFVLSYADLTFVHIAQRKMSVETNKFAVKLNCDKKKSNNGMDRPTNPRG